jgi:integrase
MNEQRNIITFPHADCGLSTESAAPFAAAAAAANRAAAHHLFADYRRRRAANTTKRQDEDLVLFGAYLRQAQIVLDADPELALNASPIQWAGLDWGIVQGFVAWMLQRGYALATINSRLSTIKVYAELAMKAGTVDADNYTRIKTVKGYQDKELRRVDDKRTITRIGKKKPTTLLISPEQAAALKQQPDTPQGRRDTVLLAMLIDHGLRCGELTLLRVEDIDMERGLFRFLRPKVQKIQTHKLWPDARQALVAYLAVDAQQAGPLLMASRKGGQLTHQGMSERAITGRVAELGRSIGIAGLSAHDLRHYWATMRARAGTPPDRMMDAGGWNSLDMPMRYIEAEKIANEGVK